ncbi:ALPHA-D-RIBOSE 1-METHYLPHOSPHONATE 5-TRIPHOSPHATE DIPHOSPHATASE [Ceraceosorus bombacis]|uniref:ALPHA-D-RIBOSE 1-METHYLPHOSPHONATE 5-TRIPHOSPHATE DIPHOSPHATASE n=1 Tax=Ceraceosorus bombacis TaxID=401625 RepID=A0A0P1BE07_9BASI|nr:ALPHA-D-RIBOSE 1-METHYLPHOSPHONATE 5-TRIPHOSPHATE DIPHOSPHATASE [Ceraceosorus bombacis]
MAGEKMPMLTGRGTARKGGASWRIRLTLLALSIAVYTLYAALRTDTTSCKTAVWPFPPTPKPSDDPNVAKCRALKVAPGAPGNFSQRVRSDRAKPRSEAPPLLIKNAKVWRADAKTGVIENASVWINNGLIKRVAGGWTAAAEMEAVAASSSDSVIIDAKGRWLTPGIIDIHVHVGVYPQPLLDGTLDVNSHQSPRTPALRSVDALNSFDLAWHQLAAGGITTGLVLPGSLNNVGGQAFPVKLGRQTLSDSRNGAWRRVVDPPAVVVGPGEGWGCNATAGDGMKRAKGQSSWRHMKMACGENAKRGYGLVRMDEALGFRSLFQRAKQLKESQDSFCSRLEQGEIQTAESFPDDLELEAVVDVLRGKVKVNTHCYTAADLEAYVRHTNEYKFPLAAFHHAHEAYLVPDLLKKAYGAPPAVALFSLNGNYKAEAISGSPFAPALLESHGLQVHIKSDHPVTDSRRLVQQVAQAHHYGFNKALESVTSAAARSLGLDHRIGHIKEGYDADLVLWSDHPLKLGSTPLQTIVDGTLQLDLSLAHQNTSKSAADSSPRQADYAHEVHRVNTSGPDILTGRANAGPEALAGRFDDLVFANVSAVYLQEGEKVRLVDLNGTGTVHIEKGTITCAGSLQACPLKTHHTVDLKGYGVITPGLTTYGSELGLSDIVSEPSTGDFASARSNFNTLVGRTSLPLSRAVDGLQWGSNDLQRALASGVTSVVVAPRSSGSFVAGISTRFRTAVEDVWNPHAILKEEIALHVWLSHLQDGDAGAISEAEQIGVLRDLLSRADRIRTHDAAEGGGYNDGVWQRVVTGKLALVVHASKAERLSTLLKLKHQHYRLRLVLAEAEEAAHGGLPAALAAAGVGVLIKPFIRPQFYDSRRALPGPPLSSNTTLSVLRAHGVKTGFLLDESWEATSLLWDASAASLEAGVERGEEVLEHLLSLESLLGLETTRDWVAYDHNPFEYGARPVAIGGPAGVAMFP